MVDGLMVNGSMVDGSLVGSGVVGVLVGGGVGVVVGVALVLDVGDVAVLVGRVGHNLDEGLINQYVLTFEIHADIEGLRPWLGSLSFVELLWLVRR